MKGVTHLTVGGLTGGLFLAVSAGAGSVSIELSNYTVYSLLVIASSAVGGLGPDVDMAHSKGGKFFRKAMRSILVLSAIFLIVLFFLPPTGINFFDGAIAMGARIDRGMLIILSAFCLLVLALIEKSKHRGFTHTFVSLLVIALPLAFMLATEISFVGANIVVSAQIGFLIGWFSHLIIDTFNRGGVPWLWPISKKKFKIMRIVTGSDAENRFVTYTMIFFIMCYAIIVL